MPISNFFPKFDVIIQGIIYLVYSYLVTICHKMQSAGQDNYSNRNSVQSSTSFVINKVYKFEVVIS